MEFITDFDTMMRENLGRVIATQDAVLLGRRTYDDWAAYWPTSDNEPFASFINGVEKLVVSSTTAEPAWSTLRVVIAPALHMHGRKLFGGGSPRRLTLTRNVVSPSDYLLLDFTLAANGPRG